MTKPAVYKHTITVTVLSTEENLRSRYDLEDIAWNMIDGDLIGEYSVTDSEKLTEEGFTTAAYAMGSDPDFFYGGYDDE